MMATAFLGYLHSPKWFNINIIYLYVLFTIYLYYVIIWKIIENKKKKEHIIKLIKYNKVKNKLYNKNKNDLIKLASYKRLYDINIDRSLIKQFIMTIPYNTSTLQGIKYLKDCFEFDYIENTYNNINTINEIESIDNSYFDLDSIEYSKNKNTNLNNIINSSKLKNSKINPNHIWYRNKNNHELKLNAADFIELYTILKHVLFNVAPSLNLISDYLKNIAKICTTANSYIP